MAEKRQNLPVPQSILGWGAPRGGRAEAADTLPAAEVCNPHLLTHGVQSLPGLMSQEGKGQTQACQLRGAGRPME